MSDIAVSIEGWSEAMRGLRKVSNELPKALRDELKAAAEIVKTEAVSNAARQGLSPPGRSGRGRGGLVRGLKTFATSSTAGVRDTANNKGFAYPKVYEFGKGRAFLFPAGRSQAPLVEARIDEMFDRLRSGAGLGGGAFSE